VDRLSRRSAAADGSGLVPKRQLAQGGPTGASRMVHYRKGPATCVLDDRPHRLGGPSYRRWTVDPDGSRKMCCEWWRVNDTWHRVDGPAYDRCAFYWHNTVVRREDLPWLRRGQGLLVAMAAFSATQHSGGIGGAIPPAWTQDARVTMARHGSGVPGVGAVTAAYRSVVGGAVALFV